MLRYPYFCRIYKEFLSCWLESGIFNLGVWPKKIHDTAQRNNDYEAQEQTDQTGTQEKHRSQDRDFEAIAKLHIPVMVDEVVRCLAPQKGQNHSIPLYPIFVLGGLTFLNYIIWLPCPLVSGWITQMGDTSWRSEIFLDMTFGSGGHTRAILQKESDITLYALDRDPAAYAIAEQLSELYPKQIRAMLGQFSQAEALLMKAGVQPGTLDGVLLDLGCSSMQLDAPERGFSLRKDGPLDMRMDGGRYPDMPTAADVVNALDQQALASILRTYGEEKHAKKIASAIVQARSLYPISRTQQLASIVAGAFPPSAVFARKDLLQRSTHIATKTFQAFRIFVNNELNELYIGLKTAQKFLRPSGRLVALSFHSLEDRIVKRFLLGISMTERFNLSARQKVIQASQLGSGHENKEGGLIGRAPLMWELIHKKVLTPEDQDVQENPRARSAKLRAAIKL
ncbi:12S rRNA N4-methylcytidine (m4C) methyltransferase isoform X1 [Mustela putorius furo]|uniref:12S rRNA N(4)-cytidine methyltransferase METTL15 n=1 Tax=Mustela putorius furo TaxID=9669 RepID=A0A8U0MTW5_MUSPF|nr:12S rRNA N4-methylcytidine (m4C) methyltransferase isoform X1 [Mustela putorius furo]XP_004755950.1 12S rRNA N4-methylcytidine (m4C) methyltransferase isoform X1 [Mustela putorius furo]